MKTPLVKRTKITKGKKALTYKEKYLLLCAQHNRLCKQVYEEDGETLKIVEVERQLACLKQTRRKFYF